MQSKAATMFHKVNEPERFGGIATFWWRCHILAALQHFGGVATFWQQCNILVAMLP